MSAAVEDLPSFEYQPTSYEVGNRILRTPLPVGAHTMSLPEGPGLGVDVDADAVAALAGYQGDRKQADRW